MYQKDKDCRITLRLNRQQFDFVKRSADQYDVSPSDFLRMVINSTMFGFQAEGEEERRENETSDKHDIV